MFNLASYQELLTKVKNLNYSFDNSNSKSQSKFYLRHDVDFDLLSVLPMAKVEHENDVMATYFVMMTNPIYSIMDSENIQAIHLLKELGHQVGLHFDSSKYGKHEIKKALEFEVDVLEKILDVKIDAFSQHQPTLNKYFQLELEDLQDINQSLSSNQYKYLSDSCMSPREDWGTFFGMQQNVQLLIHPEFWTLNCADLREFEEKYANLLVDRVKKTVTQNVEIMNQTLMNRDQLDSSVYE